MSNDITSPRASRGRGACPSLDVILKAPGIDGWARLRLSIVAMAAEDGKRLTERGLWEWYSNGEKIGCNRDELREFFTGKWCARLLHGTGWTGEEVMKRCGL